MSATPPSTTTTGAPVQPTPLLSLCNSSSGSDSPNPHSPLGNEYDNSLSSYLEEVDDPSSHNSENDESSSGDSGSSAASDIIANDLENTDLETVFGTKKAPSSMRGGQDLDLEEVPAIYGRSFTLPTSSMSAANNEEPPLASSSTPPPTPAVLNAESQKAPTPPPAKHSTPTSPSDQTKHLFVESGTHAPSARKGRVRGTSFSRVQLNAAKIHLLAPMPTLQAPVVVGGDVTPKAAKSPSTGPLAINSPCSSSTQHDESSVEHYHLPASRHDSGAHDDDKRSTPTCFLACTPDTSSTLTPTTKTKSQKVGFRVKASPSNVVHRRQLMTEEEAVRMEVYEDSKLLSRSQEPQPSPLVAGGVTRVNSQRPTALELPSPLAIGLTGNLAKSSDGESAVVSPISHTPRISPIMQMQDTAAYTPPLVMQNASLTTPVSLGNGGAMTPMATFKSASERIEEEELADIFIHVGDDDEDGPSPSPSPSALRRARGVSVKGRSRGSSIARNKPPDLDTSKVRATNSKLAIHHKHSRYAVMVKTILERGRHAFFEACRPTLSTKQICLALIVDICGTRALRRSPPNLLRANTRSRSSMKLHLARVEDKAHSPPQTTKDLATNVEHHRDASPHVNGDVVDWVAARLSPLFHFPDQQRQPISADPRILDLAFPDQTAVITPSLRCQFHKPSLDFRYCHLFLIPFKTLQSPFPDPRGDAYAALVDEHLLSKSTSEISETITEAIEAFGVVAVEQAADDLSTLLAEMVGGARALIAAMGHERPNNGNNGFLSANESFARAPSPANVIEVPPMYPPYVIQFRNPSFTNVLVELDLCHNHLTSLPEDIGAMVHLRRLVAKHNRLAHVPPSLCVCDELQYLDLSNNLLASLPSELGDMDSLEELVLDYNRFESIPSCVFNGMARLKKLFLIENSNLRNMALASSSDLLGPWLDVRLSQFKSLGSRRRDAARKLVEAHSDEIIRFVQDLAPPGLSTSTNGTSSSVNNSPASHPSVRVDTLLPPTLLIALLQRPLVEPLFEIELDNTPEIVASYSDLCVALVEGEYEVPVKALLQQAASAMLHDKLPHNAHIPTFAESLSFSANERKFFSPVGDAASDFMFHHENQQHLRVSSALVAVSWNKVWPDEVIEDLLALGSLRTVQNPTALHELGITHVLTCGRNLDTPRDFQRIVLADETVPVSETFAFASTGALVVKDPENRSQKGIRQLVLEVEDNEVQDLNKFFMHAIQFINGAKAAGGKVVCHCFAGVSRSATVVVAYVMHTMGLSSTEALKYVRTKRAAANPNPNFRRQLAKFEVACESKRALPLPESAS